MKRLFTVMTVLAVMVCTLCACGKKSAETSYNMTKADTYEETLNNLIIAMNEGNGAQYISLQYPDALVGILRHDGRFDPVVQSADQFLKETYADFEKELGSGVHAAIKGEVSAQPLTDEQKDNASDYMKYLASNQGYDLKILDIGDAYELSFTINYTGTDSSMDSEETWCAVKVGNGGWKIIVMSTDDLAGSGQEQESGSNAENQ